MIYKLMGEKKIMRFLRGLMKTFPDFRQRLAGKCLNVIHILNTHGPSNRIFDEHAFAFAAIAYTHTERVVEVF